METEPVQRSPSRQTSATTIGGGGALREDETEDGWKKG